MSEDWKRQAAGVLSIIGGALTVLSSIGIAIYVTAIAMPDLSALTIGLAVAALLAPGVMAIVGGACALRRRHWGLALAGAICALVPPLITLGILSTVWITLSRNDFRTQRDST